VLLCVILQQLAYKIVYYKQRLLKEQYKLDKKKQFNEFMNAILKEEGNIKNKGISQLFINL